MGDPLTQLRDHSNRLNEVRQQDGLIIFGDYGWPTETKTLYTIWNSGKDGGTRDYYTLETLLFFLQNSQMPHPQYTREAVEKNVPVVRLPDRKDLLAYLRGEVQTCASIDRAAPLEIALQQPVAVKKLQEKIAAETAIETAEKKPRLEEEVETPVEAAEEPVAEEDIQRVVEKAGEEEQEQSKPALPEGISADKLKEIMLKRKQRKEQVPGMPPSASEAGPVSEALKKPSSLYDKSVLPSADEDAIERFPASSADLDLERDVFSRERRWRTRLTVLRAYNTNFAESVFNTLQAIKAREEGIRHIAPAAPQPQQHPVTKPHGSSGYNRYDQEKFARKSQLNDFGINTKSSFISDRKEVQQGSRSAPVSPATQSPSSTDGGSRQKKTSRTPIIVIPASESALITMFNAQALLQDMRFIDTKERKAQGVKRDPEVCFDSFIMVMIYIIIIICIHDSQVLIQRQKEGNLTVPYRVIDSVSRLSPADWDRVVAVFVQGPAWQFKGWPWNGNPTEIFAHVKAFHLKFSELPLDANIRNWSVNVINLNRYKRHLDRASLQQFWDTLDRFMSKQKPHLRF